MANNKQLKENKIDSHMEIKVEPTLQCYVEEEHENSFSNLENASTIPSSVDVGALNLWTSKATTCLISQYKKYRSLVGQSTQIRSLREMFEMISLEMQNYGFYFSPQKCENKWRVLERKYKNLVFRERLKKPGRMRHYGQWEHKRALDEIFNEKRHVYLEANELQPSSGSTNLLIHPKPGCDQGSDSLDDRQREDPLAPMTNEKDGETLERKEILTSLFEKFIEEMAKNFALAEKNKERRHKEKMAVRHKELELKKQLLKLKEQKMELQRCQMIAAAQNLRLNIK
ncbi:PREDICTED: uncharacterized protein LOC105143365 isoform X1 [Acromyrmex echinatior]|uniref:Myb/SANT-like DNA-binding domain-containing protein n=2 Tax=Acromyrmex echinatior TaxID=103372 RepID=F4WBX1_ACREC|nr:PREDICTED: uncharacterized protein LOC105143365 isoform X1 [Acromyrmex echinatior]EGI68399.1 hypothetical protein G5I_03042 [Acromyrmex echinatior]